MNTGNINWTQWAIKIEENRGGEGGKEEENTKLCGESIGVLEDFEGEIRGLI